MKRLALLAVMLVAAGGCEKNPSKLEGKASAASAGGGGGDTTQIEGMLRGIDERLTALEQAHKTPMPSGPQADAALGERLAKIEANLTRRKEALDFLDMAYTQQKRQQEAKEANEPDPDAVFAVDISGPVQAGQTEGPSDALVTVVEAWDFG